MRAAKWTRALILISAISIPGMAQQNDPAKISLDIPLPAWPANDVVPPEMKNQFVFVDLPNNEYVVAYPENLGSPDFEKNPPAKRRIVRFKLQRNVEPKVSVAVTPTAGKYKYVYAVLNNQSAKATLDQWVLVLPDNADGIAAKAPAGWFGIFQKGRTFTVANPDWIKTGSAAVFSYEKVENQIQPGSLKVGFEVESDLKPGFTIGYFRQYEPLDAETQASGNIPQIVIKNATVAPPAGAAPPAGGGGFGGGGTPPAALTAWQPIKDEVEKLQRFEYNSKTLLTLGPKFDKSATDKAIATDFVQGITVLSKTGALSADSAFVKSTLTDLDTYIKAGGTGPLKLSSQPRGDAENEVFNALKVSLRIN
jgi:hypothetical protein